MLPRSLRPALPRAPAARRGLHTPPARCAVRLLDLRTVPGPAYPTVLNGGLSFSLDIFGRRWSPEQLAGVQRAVWNTAGFLPNRAAAPLAGTPWSALSEIAGAQAVRLADGRPGLLAGNRLRREVWRRVVHGEPKRQAFPRFLALLEDFARAPTDNKAHAISDVAFWCAWLIRGVLFEGKLHGERHTHPYVPYPLSALAHASNAALGRRQIEFVYDDYTLKAAAFPSHAAEVDYSDPASILAFVARTRTPVGFLDVAGGTPEHNFRFNHTLMELQMPPAVAAFSSLSRPGATLAEIEAGWDAVASAAERAHRVFATMMRGTPAASYPAVRLPIKGVRGACGTVYPPHGVFYEGCGADTWKGRRGCFVDREFGQTGANSTMFKWFDVLAGVAGSRAAYEPDAEGRERIARVVAGEEDAGGMGGDPIDSMQRAFDLLTRPAVHLGMLADLSETVRARPHLIDPRSDPRMAGSWEVSAFHRLRLACAVASHRCLHGSYVLRMIYAEQPVGGMSRAAGTGGSTPPFLARFFEQTRERAQAIGREILEHGRRDVLGARRWRQVGQMLEKLGGEAEQMARVQERGLALEREEEEEGRMAAVA